MQSTIFAKKRTAGDGRQFNSYLTKLTKKDGTEITVQVKFREECGEPKKFPINIVYDKSDVNYSEKSETYIDPKTQEEKETVRRILWVSKWTEGEPYVDTSMDDFAD